MLCRADLAAADGLLTVPFNGPRRNRDLLERSRTRIFRLFLWQSLQWGSAGRGLLPLVTSSGMGSSPFWGNESTAGGTALERRYFDGRTPAASRDRRTAQRASRRGVGTLARRASRWGS